MTADLRSWAGLARSLVIYRARPWRIARLAALLPRHRRARAISPSTSAPTPATAPARSSRAGARVVALEPQRALPRLPRAATCRRGVTLLPLAAGRAPGRAAPRRLAPAPDRLLARAAASPSAWPRRRASPRVRWDAAETRRGHHPRRADRRPRPARASSRSTSRASRPRCSPASSQPVPWVAFEYLPAAPRRRPRLRRPPRRPRPLRASTSSPARRRPSPSPAWLDAAAIAPALAAAPPTAARATSTPASRRCLSAPPRLGRSRPPWLLLAPPAACCPTSPAPRPAALPPLPLELPLIVLAPPRLPRPARRAARGDHRLPRPRPSVLKLADLATETAFRRPFNPVLDGDLVAAAWRLAARRRRLAARPSPPPSRSLAAVVARSPPRSGGRPAGSPASPRRRGRAALAAPRRRRARRRVADAARRRRPARRRPHRPPRLASTCATPAAPAPTSPRFRAEAAARPLRRRCRPRRSCPALPRHRRPPRLRRILRPLGAREPALRPDRSPPRSRDAEAAPRRRRPRRALGLRSPRRWSAARAGSPTPASLSGLAHRRPGPLPRAPRQPAPHAAAPRAGRRLADRRGDAGDHPRLARGRLLRLRPRPRRRRPRLPRPAVQLGDDARPVHPRRLRAPAPRPRPAPAGLRRDRAHLLARPLDADPAAPALGRARRRHGLRPLRHRRRPARGGLARPRPGARPVPPVARLHAPHASPASPRAAPPTRRSSSSSATTSPPPSSPATPTAATCRSTSSARPTRSPASTPGAGPPACSRPPTSPAWPMEAFRDRFLDAFAAEPRRRRTPFTPAVPALLFPLDAAPAVGPGGDRGPDAARRGDGRGLVGAARARRAAAPPARAAHWSRRGPRRLVALRAAGRRRPRRALPLRPGRPVARRPHRHASRRRHRRSPAPTACATCTAAARWPTPCSSASAPRSATTRA